MNDIGTVLGNAILSAFVIASILALFFLLWGGIKWIVSGGDRGKVDAARNTIIAAMIGLIVTFLSFFLLSLLSSFFSIPFTQYSISTNDTTRFITFGLGFVVTISWITTYCRKRIQESKAKLSKKTYPRSSIINIMLQRKEKSSDVIEVSLLLSALVLAFASTGQASLIVFLVLALFVIRIYIIKFRIRKGYYGTNEYEAREIIQFILDNSQSIDFTDDGTPKRILKPEDLEHLQERINEHATAFPSPA